MLAQQSVLIFATRIANMLLNMVALYLVARHVGPAALGVVAATTAFVGLFGAFSDLGLTSAHSKRVSEGQDLGRCLGAYLLLKGLLTVGTVIATVTLFALRRGTGEDTASPESVPVFTLLVIASVVSLASDMTVWTFLARREVAKQTVPSFVGFTTSAVAQIFVAIFVRTATGLAAASLLGTLVSAGLGLWLFRGYPLAWPRRADLVSYVAFAAPAALASVAGSIGGNLDKVIIEHFRGPTEVAYYYAVERITNVLLLASGALTPLLMPVLSSLHAQERADDVRAVTQRAERYLSLIIAPLCAGVIVLAEPAVLLALGQRFRPSIDVLRVTGALAYVYTTVRPYHSLLFGVNRPDLFAKITIGAMPFNAALMVIFVSSGWMGLPGLGLGAVGAAVAVLTTSLGVTVATRVLCWRVARLGFQRSIIAHLAAASLAGLIVAWLYTFWPTKPALAFVPYGALLCVLYFLFLTALGEFSLRDVRLILQALNPLSMQRYVSRELRGRAETGS